MLSTYVVEFADDLVLDQSVRILVYIYYSVYARFCFGNDQMPTTKNKQIVGTPSESKTTFQSAASNEVFSRIKAAKTTRPIVIRKIHTKFPLASNFK